jgi:hypothetical protein
LERRLKLLYITKKIIQNLAVTSHVLPAGFVIASDDVHPVGGDVSVDYKGVCGDFVNLEMMYWFSLLKVLIKVRCVYAYIRVNVYV